MLVDAGSEVLRLEMPSGRAMKGGFTGRELKYQLEQRSALWDGAGLGLDPMGLPARAKPVQQEEGSCQLGTEG